MAVETLMATRHSHHDLPILLAGSGCGTLKTGRHIRYPKEDPSQ